jgi:hypothetical protein
MEDELKEYIYKLEEMNGLLAEELGKHVNYVNKRIQRLGLELSMMNNKLKDELKDG